MGLDIKKDNYCETPLENGIVLKTVLKHPVLKHANSGVEQPKKNELINSAKILNCRP